MKVAIILLLLMQSVVGMENSSIARINKVNNSFIYMPLEIRNTIARYLLEDLQASWLERIFNDPQTRGLGTDTFFNQTAPKLTLCQIKKKQNVFKKIYAYIWHGNSFKHDSIKNVYFEGASLVAFSSDGKNKNTISRGSLNSNLILELPETCNVSLNKKYLAYLKCVFNNQSYYVRKIVIMDWARQKKDKINLNAKEVIGYGPVCNLDICKFPHCPQNAVSFIKGFAVSPDGCQVAIANGVGIIILTRYQSENSKPYIKKIVAMQSNVKPVTMVFDITNTVLFYKIGQSDIKAHFLLSEQEASRIDLLEMYLRCKGVSKKIPYGIEK